ncbi:MAG: TolC family protein, partial [Gemmatimonadales bacterium]
MDARKLSVVALLAFAGTLDAQVRSVTLSEAIDLALQVNPAMVQARGDVLNAVASRRENLGSWLPSVTGSSSYSTNSASRFDPNTQRTVSAASTSYSAGLSATLNVFDGFRRNAEGRSATAGLESAEASLLNQRYQIILQTKQAFFNSLAADELVLVAERRIERADRQLDISREKLAHGTAIRSDTLRSVVELANARLQLLNTQTQRSTADANLARLIGVDGEVRARPDPSSLDQAVMLDTAMVRRQALQNSPEIVQSEAQARAAQAQMA